MRSVRQLASGLFYALVSVVLVVGGLSLALAERSNTISSPTETQTPTMLPATWTPSLPSPTETQAAATTVVGSPTSTATFLFPTIYIPPTSANTGPPSCGPLAGWIKSYVVQPGDTLFHIATLYQTTTANLERANCKASSIIFVGERLWVPNVPTITPGVTIIPTFATPTEYPTEPLTLTPLPFTLTPDPTDTSDPNPSSTP